MVKTLLLLLVVGMTSCVSSKKFKALEEENNTLSEELADIKATVGELQEQNASLDEENGEMSSNLQNVQQQLNQTETRLTQVEKDAAMKEQKLNTMDSELDAAFADINAAVSSTNAKVKEMANALYLDLADTVRFRTGSAAVKASDKEAIERIAQLLKDQPNLHLVIEGNTDKRSISNDTFADNWELSSQRAINVVRKLIDLGVNPEQLTAAGRAEFNPAATDDPDSKATLAKNRRIELMVLPDVGTIYKLANQ